MHLCIHLFHIFSNIAQLLHFVFFYFSLFCFVLVRLMNLSRGELSFQHFRNFNLHEGGKGMAAQWLKREETVQRAYVFCKFWIAYGCFANLGFESKWVVFSFCYMIIQCKIELYVFIFCEYTSVFMLRAGQLSAWVKCTSRLEGII